MIRYFRNEPLIFAWDYNIVLLSLFVNKNSFKTKPIPGKLKKKKREKKERTKQRISFFLLAAVLQRLFKKMHIYDTLVNTKIEHWKLKKELNMTLVLRIIVILQSLRCLFYSWSDLVMENAAFSLICNLYFVICNFKASSDLFGCGLPRLGLSST